MRNAIPDRANDVTSRIARQSLERRRIDHEGEVRRLLDAALDVVRRCGTTSRPRVVDIVAAAGVSNDAFYRYFPSKDALFAAILEDGTERLQSYLAHQMAKETTPQDKVRRWVEGVLAQAADEEIAATTLAVLWNGGSVGEGLPTGRPSASQPLATLLREPFAELGSTDPELDASLAAHAVVGRLSDDLWSRARPSREAIDHVADVCLAIATARTAGRP
ncbi:MAG TPA: TetR/AcrR family transcriptional regulator [Acidimicrobiales bacterium]|nr:TetR/AcrR family transcriptional regulator [Acidimicrobiales bacterium]